MTILDQLAAHARQRVAAYKAILPLEEVRRQCEALPKGSFALDAALAKPGLSFIGECKKASPSKGTDRTGISLSGPDSRPSPRPPAVAVPPHGLHCGRCHCGFGHREADGPIRQRGPGPRGRICAPDEAGPVTFQRPWPALSVCGAFSQSNFPKIQTQNPAPNCTAVRFRAGLLFLRVCLWVRGSCVPSVRSVHPAGWPAGRGSTPPGRPGRH